MVRGGDEEWRRTRRKLFGEGKLMVRSTDRATGWIYSAICLFECYTIEGKDLQFICNLLTAAIGGIMHTIN